MLPLPPPYVGITGIMQPDDTSGALEYFERPETYKLMVGVLASKTTLLGNPPSNPNRYPPKDVIRHLFLDDDRLLNLIHYNTSDLDTLSGQLEEMRWHAGPNCHGFQLNIPWPDPAAIKTHLKMRPGSTIVLQVGPRAFERIDHSPFLLTRRLQEYIGLAQYVLLDASGGTGRLLSPESLLQYLATAYHHGLNNHFRFVIAGGLSGANLYHARPLIAQYPNLSIDAEGGLRNKNDRLFPPAVMQYLEACWREGLLS